MSRNNVARGIHVSHSAGANEVETYFKFVAELDDGRYVSIFDGTTEYRLTELLHREVRAGHKGGIYVCQSLYDLLSLSPLPSKSACLDVPWAVVRMIGWGGKLSYSEHGSSKLAISHVLPVKFVSFPADAKARFIRRSQRMFAAAQALREGGAAPPTRRVLRPTPQETQEIYQDWMQLLELIGNGDEE